MNFKSTLRKGAELGVVLSALTTMILIGCGGGGSSASGNNQVTAATSSTITPYKGPFAQGAIVTITDANGNPVTLFTGGTVGANGVISVTYNQNVTYPLLVSVTGRYYNEVTGMYETTTVPLRSLITNAAAAANVPVTIVTETAVDLLLNQAGSISATNPIQAASAVADLSAAGTIFGIPASAVPAFVAGTTKTSDPNTILLSALAVVANTQTGTTLADKVVALANSLATLNPASAPSDVISQIALLNAITAMTSGASSVAAAGVTPPSAPSISTAPISLTITNAAVSVSNSIVGTWYDGNTNDSVITFFANGDYVQAKSVTTNPGATPGLEHSTYTFDGATGAFVPTCPAAVDTNGADGFCNGSSATTFNFTLSGNTISYTNSHAQSGTLTRVLDSSNPFIGTWYNGNTNDSVITFFANGDYVQAKSVTTNPGATPGLEHSTYTFNGATGAFVPTCPAAVDTNGADGFCNGSSATTFNFTLSGNTATFTNSHLQSGTEIRVDPITAQKRLMGGSRQGASLFLSGIVTTFAGSGSLGSVNATGTSASFNGPGSITTDGRNLYVADNGSNLIRQIVIATGAVTTIAGSGSAGALDGTGTSASFNSPTAITTDGTNLYVVDGGNNKIRQIVISTGVVTTLAGSGAAGSLDATGITATFNSSGTDGITTDGTNLYVSDSGNNLIRKIVISSGVVTTLAGTGSAGAVDATGISASFNFLSGSDVQTDGVNLYVVDGGNNKIRVITPSSGTLNSMTSLNAVVSTFAGSGAAGAIDATGTAASFNAPSCLTSDGINLYLADAGNNKIRKIVISTRVVTTLAGSGTAGAVNGTGTSASFNSPNDITTDGISLYVAESNTNLIRMIQ